MNSRRLRPIAYWSICFLAAMLVAPSKARSSEADSLRLDKLKSQVDQLTLEKQVLDLSKQLYSSVLPHFDSVKARSALSIDDSVSVEMRILILMQYERVADSIVREIRDAIGGDRISEYKNESIQRISRYVSFLGMLRYTNLTLQDVVGRKMPAFSLIPGLIGPEVLAVAPAVLSSVNNLLSLFRTEESIRSRSLQGDSDLLRNLICKRLEPSQFVVGDRVVPDMPVFGSDRAGPLAKEITHLMKLSSTLDEKIDSMSVRANSGAKDAIPSLRLSNLTALRDSVQALMRQLTSVTASGASPLVELLATEAFLSPGGANPLKHLLDCGVLGVTVTRKDRQKVLTGGSTRVAIQVMCSYMLTRLDGTVVKSNVVQCNSGYVELKKLVRDVR